MKRNEIKTCLQIILHLYVFEELFLVGINT